MAENYKHLYEQMKTMVARYQDEIVPGMREQLEKCVEVVRCKDCQYYEREECVCPYMAMSDSAHYYPDPDDFCSYGERKDGDTE